MSTRMTTSHYYWIREIARGGMGRVDLIIRSEGAFRRLAAVKRLHAKLRDDVECRAMFLDEARIAGMLKHPNIVTVFDVGEDDEGPYLIMDYIDGLSVQAITRRSAQDYTPLPLAVVVQIIVQAADGLHAAHELTAPDGSVLNLVHRDVSPHNMIVGYDGIVRVMDFGIARALGRTTQTSTGVLKGKLAYMSPEQLRFRPADRRSDIFALGVVLYEMLTLKRLYSNRDGDGPQRILEEPPPDVGLERDDLPPALVELVFRMLAKEPTKRPATAAEVANCLREILNDLMIVDDEAIELQEYFRHRFEPETTGHRQEIQSALKRLDEGTLPAWPLTDPALVLAPAVMNAPKRWLLALGAGLLVTLAVGAGVIIGRSPELEPERQVESPSTVASPAPPAAQTPLAPAAVHVETHAAEPEPATPSDIGESGE
ncbi:MAG: serine/threonine protein kinase, partial [Polyangiales bacterium]